MATVTLKGNPLNTSGTLPKVGTKAPDFSLVASDLSKKTLADYSGSRVVLNVFHSIDTGTCEASVRAFNKSVSNLENTQVLCISKDLPFAMSRFCGAEGIDNLVMLSDFIDTSFGKAYGLDYIDGVIEGLLSRCIIVLDENGTVIYTEQVQVVEGEPDYDAALNALK